MKYLGMFDVGEMSAITNPSECHAADLADAMRARVVGVKVRRRCGG